MPDSTDKLIRLAELHEKGLLSREEFEDQKARLLEGPDDGHRMARGARSEHATQPVMILAAAGVIAVLLLVGVAGFLLFSTSAP